MSCTDDEDNVTEYYGVIEDIIKIKWEGSMHLELVLFDCRWFNPTTGVRRSPNLGLVEIKRTSRLQTYEPFVLASQVTQVTQVYYLSYACKTRSDLIDWQVVYHVPPRGYVQTSDNATESNPSEGPVEVAPVFQEEELHGNFTIDLDLNPDNMTLLISDEITITNTRDLELLANPNIDCEDKW